MTSLLSTAISTHSFLILQCFPYYSVTFELVSFFLDYHFHLKDILQLIPPSAEVAINTGKSKRCCHHYYKCRVGVKGMVREGKVLFSKALCFSHVSWFEKIEIHSYFFTS